MKSMPQLGGYACVCVAINTLTLILSVCACVCACVCNGSGQPGQLGFLCYKTHKWWLRDVLKQCSAMNREEAKARVSACYSGEMVTVLALFGAGMQLCIFPEYVSVNGTRTTDEKRKAIQKRKKAEHEAPVRQQPVGKMLEDTLGFGDFQQADESDSDEHLCGHQNSAKPGNGSSGDAAAS